jgi:multiple sugar transport system substrate-binding protein
MLNFSKKANLRRLFVAMSLLLVVLVAAQCVAPAPQQATQAPAATEEPATEAPTAAPAAEEPTQAPQAMAQADNPFAEGCWDFPTENVSIEIWWHEYGPFTAYVYELIDRYQQMHPNVTINPVVASQADLNQKLTVALASGTGPDILDQDISFYSAYYDKGVLDPIKLDVFCTDSQSDIEAQYIGNVLEGVTFDGSIYGLPYQTNSMSFFLSTDAFNEVGLDAVKDAPKTWDDLKRVGAMLKKVENGATVRKGYDFPYQSQRWQLQAFQPMVEQFGGTLLNEDQTQCLLNSEPAVQALTLWKEVTEVTGDPSVSLATPSQPNQDFIDGRVAIWMTGPWATNQLLESQIGDRWAVTSLPQLDPDNPHTMMYGFTWGVNADKPDLNKLVAWDFVRFMLSNPEEWLQKASFIQPRVGLLDTETAKTFPFIDVHLRDVETASWYLRSVHTNEIVQIVGRAIERTIFEGTDPQTSLDQAQQECDQVLAQ